MRDGASRPRSGRPPVHLRVWAMGRAPAVSEVPTEDPRPDDLQRAPLGRHRQHRRQQGKSSAAFGVMIRAIARGWPVAVVQFIKSGKWHVGEEDIGRRLGVEEFNVGDGFTWDSADLDHDKALARQGWETAAELIAAGEHRLVVLDEVTYLYLGLDRHAIGLADDPRPAGEHQPDGHRCATPELIDVAGTVTEMRKVNTPTTVASAIRGIGAQRSVDLRSRLDDLPQPDLAAVAAVHAQAADILRPPGALHWLDDVAADRRATTAAAEVEHPVGLVFAADHGVAAAAKVSALEPCVTAAMFAAFAEGRSTIRSFAAARRGDRGGGRRGIGKPTGDIRYEAAMSEERFAQIVDIAWTAVDALDGDLLVLGEMGIGNTAASAAVACAGRWGDGGVGRPGHGHRRRHADRQANRRAGGGAPHRRRHRSTGSAARGQRQARGHRCGSGRRLPPLAPARSRRLRRHGLGAAPRAPRADRARALHGRACSAEPDTGACSTASASARCSTSTCVSAKAAGRWPRAPHRRPAPASPRCPRSPSGFRSTTRGCRPSSIRILIRRDVDQLETSAEMRSRPSVMASSLTAKDRRT